jgi:hypothetical protein
MGMLCQNGGAVVRGSNATDTTTTCPVGSRVHAMIAKQEIHPRACESERRSALPFKGPSGFVRFERFIRFSRFPFGLGKCDFPRENGKKFGLFGLYRFAIGGGKANGRRRKAPNTQAHKHPPSPRLRRTSQRSTKSQTPRRKCAVCLLPQFASVRLARGPLSVPAQSGEVRRKGETGRVVFHLYTLISLIYAWLGSERGFCRRHFGTHTGGTC